MVMFVPAQMYIMCCTGSRRGRLTGPFVSLSLVSLAVLAGINRVAEYRNHWSDVLAGQTIGGAVAIFLVRFVLASSRKHVSFGITKDDRHT